MQHNCNQEDPFSTKKTKKNSDRGISEQGTPISKSEDKYKEQSEGGHRAEAKRNMRKQRANTHQLEIRTETNSDKIPVLINVRQFD